MRKRSLAAYLVLGSVACSTATPQVVTAPPASPATPTRTVSESPLHSFADLVRNAAQRDGKSEDNPDCLLRTGPAGQQFVGEVAVGIRPLPMPATDLDAALAQSISVGVLSAYGRYGEAVTPLTLSAISYAPPTRDAAALLLTDQGCHVRGTAAGGPLLDRVSPSEAVQAVRALRDTTVFVAAEADTPLTTLRALLEQLDQAGVASALAVNLSSETSLPAPPRLRDVSCPNGLPESVGPEGDLDVQSLAPTLAQLRQHATSCLGSADPRGAAGGRMKVGFRVSPRGAVAMACVTHDEIGDPRLRQCVVEALEKLTFPAPAPAGLVDLELPLTLQAHHRPVPRATCAATLQ